MKVKRRNMTHFNFPTQFYPGSSDAAACEVGRGAGRGFNVNVCWDMTGKELALDQARKHSFPRYYSEEEQQRRYPLDDEDDDEDDELSAYFRSLGNHGGGGGGDDDDDEDEEAGITAAGDADYLYCWERVLLPIARQFRPQLTLISAGFDAAKGDPLGGCNLTARGYGHLTKQLMDVTPNGKVVLVLEGGYDLRAISTCFAECVRVLQGGSPVPYPRARVPLVPSLQAVAAIRESVRLLEPYWVLRGDRPHAGGAMAEQPLLITPLSVEHAHSVVDVGSVVPYDARPRVDPTNGRKRPIWGFAFTQGHRCQGRMGYSTRSRARLAFIAPFPHRRLNSWWIDLRHCPTISRIARMHRGKREVASLLAPVTLSGTKRKRDGKSRHGEAPSKSWAEELCDELVAEGEAEQNKNKNKSVTRPSSRASIALAAGGEFSASEKKRERAYQRELAALAQSRLQGSAFSALDYAMGSDADSDASVSDDISGEIDDMINEQDEFAAEDDEKRRDQIEEQIENEKYFHAQAFGGDSDDYEKDKKERRNEEEEEEEEEEEDIGSEDEEDAKNFSFGFFERFSKKKTAKGTNTAKDKKMHKVVPRTTHAGKKSNDKAVDLFPPLPRSGEKKKGLSKELERLAKDAAEANQKQQPTKTPKKKRKAEKGHM